MNRFFLLLLFLLLASFADAALVTRYVNTASSGGDGTTNATAGANAAYATLSAWEEAEETDLVSATDTHIVHCEGTAADTTAVTVDGWTTDETYYITIQVDQANRHNGKWDTSAYRLDLDNESPGLALNQDVKLIGLQVRNTLTSHFKDTIKYDTGQDIVDVSYCVFMEEGNYVGKLFSMAAYSFNGNTYNFYNNVFYVGSNFDFGGEHCFSLETNASTTDFYINLFNNTLIGGNDVCVNIEDADAIVTAKNNIVGDAISTNVSITTESGSDYNASDSASNFDSGGGHNRDSQTFTFVDAGNQDFHLDAADAGARTYGVTDPGSGLFDDDIDGQTRTTPWDIGADQVSFAAGGHASPLIGGPRLKSKFRGLIR